MARPSGRRGPDHSRFRRLKAEMLIESDICGICGHPGAATADHIVPWAVWPRDPLTGELEPGVDERDNMQPAHGTGNRCAVCGRLCNQEKGDGTRRRYPSRRPQTRDW